MNRIVGVTELQKRFRSIFDDVVKRGIPYILTRGSRAEAVLIPYEDYVHYQEFQENEILERFDRLLERMKEQNRKFSEEEIKADILKAKSKRNLP